MHNLAVNTVCVDLDIDQVTSLCRWTRHSVRAVASGSRLFVDLMVVEKESRCHTILQTILVWKEISHRLLQVEDGSETPIRGFLTLEFSLSLILAFTRI